jgi:predicted N-acetyltransferase YhbS
MANIEYAKLEETDVLSISEIHKHELEIGVLTLFGSPFLIQMYLSLLSRGNWGFVAKVEGETVGYIIATQTEISLLKCLSIQSILRFLLNSVSNPLKFFSFLIAFREHYLNNSNDRIIPTRTMIELSHFAIKEDWKSKGIGGNLIEKLEAKAKGCGFSSVFTRTHNERLSSYYIKNRRAKVLKRLPMASYDSLILKWEI